VSEQVPDPEFDDSSKWTFIGTGSSVTSGQLRFANPIIASSDTVPTISTVIGATYTYKFTVERSPVSAITQRILFGGVEIYNQDGAGDFSGEVTPINSSGLIFLAQLAGQWYLDRISIMASAEADVYTALTGYAGLQALIPTTDSPVQYKVYPILMPQDVTYPAVVYQRIVGTRANLMADGGGSGVERVLFQFTAWATTMLAAYNVMEQVRLALVAASFEVVFQVSRAGHEPDTGLFSFTYDIAVWHR